MTQVVTQPQAGSAAPNQAELESLVKLALQEARAGGADQAEAGVSFSAGLSTTVRLGEVETLEYQRDRGMAITVFINQRKGSASTADLRPESVREAARKALSIASFTAPDEFAGLAEAELMARDVPDLGLSYPWALEPEAAIELARACEAAALAADPRVKNSEGASIGTRRDLQVYGNSHGFLGTVASTDHSLSCSVIAVVGEEMQRDYWYTATRDYRELENAEAVGRRSAERAVARLGSRRLSTRHTPVMFAAEVARGFFGHFLSAVSGGAQYRKSSFLLGAAGQQVFPSWLNLSERPHLLKAMGSAPFDNEGVATRDRELVAGGVLQGYILSSYSARKLGLKSTGNAGGVHNLLVNHGAEDQAALLKRMDKGFFVTELMGQGVNTVTGDYSRGASGFWVENGELQYPVHEVTIAGNLREMLAGVVAVGSDVDVRGSMRTGSVLIGEMMLAGE